MYRLTRYLSCESGASAAEYTLILAILGVGIAVTLFFLGGAIGNAVDKASDCIVNSANPTPTC